MSKLQEIGTWLESRLPALLAENKVPGAAVAVYAGGEIVEAAAGVLNRNTGVETTTDSVFQIGSITKVWTTTLAMQLVDEGELDLDVPVRAYLPDFKLKDEEAAARVTTRQLLSHTAGFEGDIFTDTGRGDDAIQKLVDTFADVPQLFAPGELFSYNNAGFCVLGRLIEVLRGKPFADCLTEYLVTPLGLTHVAPSPYEAVRFRAAHGHIQAEPDAEPELAPASVLAPSNAPAGSMLAMRPRDLITFAAAHLRDGEAPNGTRVLSAESARAMRETQVQVPLTGLLGDTWGLGWTLYDWPGGPVPGHDGGTIGQSAFLRTVPGKDVAVVVLTNGGAVMAVAQEILAKALSGLAGVDVPALPVPDAAASRVDATRFVGEYASSVDRTVISQDEDGRVWMEKLPKGIFADLLVPSKIELVAFGENTLIPLEPIQGIYLPHSFIGDDGEGRALLLHAGRGVLRVTA
ncbi:serine hydrolase domain-containing protein [Amycolatopsis sp. NPDC059657]|uniref:serine hydrolase domain-containing protein n=1 Tax=Amycolatopsis sp. NPDC059657 TaxID=3346899 RepID=UPI0036713DBF